MENKNKRVRFDELEQKPKKKKKFNLFDMWYSKRNEPTGDDEVFHPRTLKYFFPFCWNNFSRLFYLNLLFILGNFPIFIILLAMSQNLHLHATCPVNPLFAPFYGAAQMGASTPVSSAFYGVFGVTSNVALWTPAATAVLILGAVLILITFGPITAATTYIHRNIVKGEPIFLWQDFVHALKKNFFQALIMGILDLSFIFVLLYDIFFFYLNPQLTMSGAFIVISLAALILYFIMRYYIYIMLVTFKLSIFKMLKNAFIFTLLGFKRNFMATVGIVFVVCANFALAMMFMPLGIALPFFITVSLCQFMSVYAAWPKIKEIMIDPYYVDGEANGESESQEENI